MENLEFTLHDLNYVGDYKQYEEERQANEKIRIENENERIANETERVNQEETRKLAEIRRNEKAEEQLAKLKETEEELIKKGESGEFKGDKGEQGEKGEPGEQGLPGYSPVRGVDYWTDEDINAMKSDNRDYIDSLIGTPLDSINGEVV